MLSDELKSAVEETLKKECGDPSGIEKVSPVGGGSINEAYRLESGQSRYFLKVNHAERFPGMFEAELKGLQFLSEPDVIGVPEPLAIGEAGNEAFILMEFIEGGRADDVFWERFGKELARLHQQSAEAFGLDHDNYIGSLPQWNEKRSDWPTFFAEMRLEPQLKMARDSGRMGSSDTRLFEKLYGRLGEYFPEEPPALVHGDLWSGNYMVGAEGTPYIVDPAVYYGHREMDIGMSTMFGRFGEAFYRSYNEEYPLEAGWEERLDLANLYPLMVHVNLFGGGFASEVRGILKRFT